MNITTEDVKALRDKTGISVMQCKKALEEAQGDAQKALAILQSKGKEIASKKGQRSLGAGIIASYIHNNGAVGAMVELSSWLTLAKSISQYKKRAINASRSLAFRILIAILKKLTIRYLEMMHRSPV